MWAVHGSVAGRHAALCGVGGRGPVVPLVPVAGLWATVWCQHGECCVGGWGCSCGMPSRCVNAMYLSRAAGRVYGWSWSLPPCLAAV